MNNHMHDFNQLLVSYNQQLFSDWVMLDMCARCNHIFFIHIIAKLHFIYFSGPGKKTAQQEKK